MSIITEKSLYHIKQKGIPPKQILKMHQKNSRKCLLQTIVLTMRLHIWYNNLLSLIISSWPKVIPPRILQLLRHPLLTILNMLLPPPPKPERIQIRIIIPPLAMPILPMTPMPMPLSPGLLLLTPKKNLLPDLLTVPPNPITPLYLLLYMCMLYLL